VITFFGGFNQFVNSIKLILQLFRSFESEAELKFLGFTLIILQVASDSLTSSGNPLEDWLFNKWLKTAR
jgi:hypothetical protein